MDAARQQEAQAVLDRAVAGPLRVPGVSAGLTSATGTLWQGAAGVRRLDDEAPMTPDTVLAAFSCTKAVTAVASLQLVEQGRLDLDAPAREHVPALGELQVLAGFADDGTPQLRPPARDVTTRMLLLHTAGFGYDFFSPDYSRLAREHGQPATVTGRHAALRTPLLFDPGERWEYGSGVDWAGLVVEAVTGRRLGEVLHDHLLAPLGMTSTSFVLSEQMRSRRATVHSRSPDGTLTPHARPAFPAEPEVQMGGHALWTTTTDYLALLRMLLDDGRAPDGTPVLQPATVRDAVREQLGGLRCRPLPGVVPALSHDVDLFPGQPTSWAPLGMVNLEDAATGRPAGSVGWAGLANLYWWLDRRSGLAGFWATQVLPFVDPTSLAGAHELEALAYRLPR